MSEVGFGVLLGVVAGLLVATFVILSVVIKSLKCLQEIRDLLKDRKDD